MSWSVWATHWLSDPIIRSVSKDTVVVLKSDWGEAS